MSPNYEELKELVSLIGSSCLRHFIGDVENLVSSTPRIGHLKHGYRRIFVYTFCLINICLSLSDDANKIKTLNIERA